MNDRSIHLYLVEQENGRQVARHIAPAPYRPGRFEFGLGLVIYAMLGAAAAYMLIKVYS